MEEVPEEVLKDIFDKVNSEDTFARLIRMKLLKSYLALHGPPSPLLIRLSISTKWPTGGPSFQ